MISASHNPYHDNGLKAFAHDGLKLPDSEELALERRIFEILPAAPDNPEEFPLLSKENVAGDYVQFLASCATADLSGLSIVLDCAHGASFRPEDGHCIGGPCRGSSLGAVAVVEAEAEHASSPAP